MTPEQLAPFLRLWPGTDGARLNLINLSENHTFVVHKADGTRAVLRVHRPGYQSVAAIRSELAWLAAVAADTPIPVPRVLPGRDGDVIQTLPVDGERHAVLFAFVPGTEPEQSGDLAGLFETLGTYAAQLHRQSHAWPHPAGFERPRWDCDAILAPNGLWGDWRTAPGVTADIRKTLDRASYALREAFAAYGQGPDRFGLIHADMRLTNLLVHGGETRLIDFDDCGFGWFVYDFGAAVSFFETDPGVERLKQVWVNAYRRHRPFSAEDEAMLDSAVLLRRMVLLAWIGSHAEVDLAQSMASHFAVGTVDLAERYLHSAIRPR